MTILFRWLLKRYRRKLVKMPYDIKRAKVIQAIDCVLREG